MLLNQGYRVGDLSLVYPLARGTGPLLSSLGGDCISRRAAVGFRALRRAADHRRRRCLDDQPHANCARATRATRFVYALITGMFIAAYTLWDKQAVSHFGITPLVLDWGANVGRAILLTPFALKYSDQTVDGVA